MSEPDKELEYEPSVEITAQVMTLAKTAGIQAHDLMGAVVALVMAYQNDPENFYKQSHFSITVIRNNQSTQH